MIRGQCQILKLKIRDKVRDFERISLQPQATAAPLGAFASSDKYLPGEWKKSGARVPAAAPHAQAVDFHMIS